MPIIYNNTCVTETGQNITPAGCGSAWLERLIWDQEVAGSNPVTPTYNSDICLFPFAGVVQW